MSLLFFCMNVLILSLINSNAYANGFTRRIGLDSHQGERKIIQHLGIGRVQMVNGTKRINHTAFWSTVGCLLVLWDIHNLWMVIPGAFFILASFGLALDAIRRWDSYGPTFIAVVGPIIFLIFMGT